MRHVGRHAEEGDAKGLLDLPSHAEGRHARVASSSDEASARTGVEEGRQDGAPGSGRMAWPRRRGSGRAAAQQGAARESAARENATRPVRADGAALASVAHLGGCPKRERDAGKRRRELLADDLARRRVSASGTGGKTQDPPWVSQALVRLAASVGKLGGPHLDVGVVENATGDHAFEHARSHRGDIGKAAEHVQDRLRAVGDNVERPLYAVAHTGASAPGCVQTSWMCRWEGPQTAAHLVEIGEWLNTSASHGDPLTHPRCRLGRVAPLCHHDFAFQVVEGVDVIA